MRIALDTNVIAYAEGFDDDERGNQARQSLEQLSHHEFVLPVQACAELTQVVVRKFRRSLDEASTVVRRWRQLCPIQPASTSTTFATALDLSVHHRIQIFDALILAAAQEAGSSAVLSEDMREGFIWRGITVVNPFAAKPHPMLVDLMRR